MKKTLKDFTSRTRRIDLIHPEAGNTGAWIEVRSVRCNEYLQKLSELDRRDGVEKNSFIENLNDTATLTATLVTDWDEEFFEQEFSYEACENLFKQAEYSWIRDAVNQAQEDQASFFQKS